ncbi:membrane-bound acylglycerophosphatidylinositol O-acyltransferase mboat7 [Cetorhinus maximus]
MSLDELKYVAVLAGSIPVGIFMKQTGTLVRGLGATVFGFSMVFATCGFHTFHSLLTIIITWCIIKFSSRHCYYLTLLWTFAYLLFFRMQAFLKLPVPTPFANAVQLLLTLKMVSLAAELNRAYLDSVSRQVEQSGPTRGRIIAGLMPGLKDMIYYSYCYLGIMTGPFYRYKTYQDWVYDADLNKIPSWRPMLERLRLGPLYGVAFLLVSRLCPLEYVKTEAFTEHSLLYRLFYTSLIFLVFRLRFYVAWTFAECACMSAAFGAYPVGAKARPGNGPTHQYYTAGSEVQEYDFETIRNIDPHNTDFCTSVKDGMKYWNMTVQWWLANYIYRSAPVKTRILR